MNGTIVNLLPLIIFGIKGYLMKKIDAKSVLSLYCILMGSAPYSFLSEKSKKTTMLTTGRIARDIRDAT